MHIPLGTSVLLGWNLLFALCSKSDFKHPLLKVDMRQGKNNHFFLLISASYKYLIESILGGFG